MNVDADTCYEVLAILVTGIPPESVALLQDVSIDIIKLKCLIANACLVLQDVEHFPVEAEMGALRDLLNCNLGCSDHLQATQLLQLQSAAMEALVNIRQPNSCSCKVLPWRRW